MKKVNLSEAKVLFLKLIEEAAQGKEIIIMDAGKPVAKLCPFKAKKTERRPGMYKGKLVFNSDFDAPLSDDILNEFEKK